MSEKKTYQIGELSESFGISQRTIRYYEELHLIDSIRTEGGFRLYNEAQIERLQTILTLKELGISLEKISELLELCKHGGQGKNNIPLLLKNLKEKKEEFIKKIEKYNEGIKELDQLMRMLKLCEHCEKPIKECSCEKCMQEHGEPASPLVKTLL